MRMARPVAHVNRLLRQGPPGALTAGHGAVARRRWSRCTTTVLSVTLYLVRHAHAGRRSEWDAADADRPLSEKGGHQTEALTRHLDDAPVTQVLSSAALRCRQTVAPLARQRGLEVESHPALLEGATARSTTQLLWDLAANGEDAVLSSHGDVIPSALVALRADGVEVDDHHGLPKATLYRLQVDDGHITSGTFVDPRP